LSEVNVRQHQCFPTWSAKVKRWSATDSLLLHDDQYQQHFDVA